MKKERLNLVIKEMKNNNLSQLIVTSSASIFYLTGRWISPGERMLALYINTYGKCTLILNELFPMEPVEDLEVINYKDIDEPIDILTSITSNEVLGIDKDWQAKFLLKLMEKNKVEGFINSSPIIDKIRMCKDEEEKNLMREASRINDKVVEEAIKFLKEGIREKEVGALLAELYEKEDTMGFSFSPIVAFGKNGADPHHSTGNSKLKSGDPITIDTGCRYKNYCSDMTRSLIFKENNDEYKEVYNIVLEANKLGINAVKPGAKFSDVDNATRNYIESKGYGKYFTHRTGHSIGIEVHEFGDVSSVNNDELKPGMIFSVEPGIYIPGKFGIRIEDLVMVTEDGYEVLNKLNKEYEVR